MAGASPPTGAPRRPHLVSSLLWSDRPTCRLPPCRRRDTPGSATSRSPSRRPRHVAPLRSGGRLTPTESGRVGALTWRDLPESGVPREGRPRPSTSRQAARSWAPARRGTIRSPAPTATSGPRPLSGSNGWRARSTSAGDFTRPRSQAELVLHARDRVALGASAASSIVASKFEHPISRTLARADQFVQRTERVLDRGRVVGRVELIEVDPIVCRRRRLARRPRGRTRVSRRPRVRDQHAYLRTSSRARRGPSFPDGSVRGTPRCGCCRSCRP